MNDHEAIRRLIALYGQLLDSKRLEEWGDLFVDDAVFRVWDDTYSGRAEIQREIGGMQPEHPGKHVILQPVINLDDEHHARAWTDLSAFSMAEDQSISIATIGRYHDRLERGGQDGRWRFRQRVIVMEGEGVPADVDPSPSF